MKERTICPECGNVLLKRVDREIVSRNAMLYVGGGKDAFRCECGSNVFTHFKDDEGDMWECHGCSAEYRGEPNTPVAAEKGAEA